MKRLIKPLWLALATLSALLTVVSCVKELAVKEQEVNFESSLTTEQSQIVKGDSTVTTQLLINEEEVDCPRPTKYSVSFTYDEEAGTLFFLGDSIQSGKPIALSSLSNLALTYQAKKLVGNKVDVTVSNDAPKKLSKDLVWNILADKTYWVKSEQEGEGEITITGADDLDAVEPDTKLAVTAKPADGWELVTLTANEEDILEDKSFVVTENTIVRATFKELTPETYAVTLTKEGEGKVAITGADNLDAVVAGSKLTVTATPADGWSIASMTANGVDILASSSFVVESDTNVKVVFKKQPPKTYAVTLTKEGEGTVAISGADDLGAVVTGSKLTVTATPADGWEVSSITANGKDITTDKSFVVTSNTVVKVVFKKLPPKTYAVTLTKEGEGTVDISGADNLGAVVTGSKLTVTATPADGWEISSITANGRDITTDKSFVVTSNTTVKVVFKKQPPKTYKVTLVKEGEGTVAISGADNLDAVVTGSKLTVTATPADGWEVKSITANGKDITTDKSFVVTENTMVRAIFEEKALEICTYTIGLLKEGEGKVVVAPMKPVKPASLYGSGVPTIEIDPFEIDPSRINHVPCGVEVTLIATPADGWKLVSLEADGWDPLFGKSFSINRNTTVRATFTKKAPTTYAVTLTKEGEGTVAISGADNLGAVVTGSKLTVTAEPADGWEIGSITMNGKDITAEKSFVITSNTVVKVVFKKQPPKTYKVTLVQEGEGTVAILGANNLDSVEAGTRLKVKVNTDQIWKVVSMTANGIDILPNKSWKELVEAWLTVTSDIEIKVILKPSYEVEVFLDGRGKVTVPTPDGRVYTLQDKPNTSDEHQYILSAITRIAIGEKLTVTAEPAEGWKVARITANGVDITVSKTFTVTSDTKLRVFSLKKTSKTSKTYKVTVICSEGGSIELKRYNRAFERYEPIDLDRVPEGTALTVFSNPNEGYELSQCLFNGILRYGGVINEDTEVRAVFRPKY